MKKILYIVSTLKRSGPTNQLYNLIKNLDSGEFEPHVLTLSREPSDSRWADYKALGVQTHSIALSRAAGVVFARGFIKKAIDRIQPDLIHSQGIRADVLSARLSPSLPKIASIRNFPQYDYSMTYGRVQAKLMLWQHTKAMRKLDICVGVSEAVSANLLREFNISNTVTISNGVDTELFCSVSVLEKKIIREKLDLGLGSEIWISSGHLSARKDPLLIISAWIELFGNDSKKQLIFLGDGPEREECENTISGFQNVRILGRVDNVSDYLKAGDYFISASKAEGLPNAVLEALASGLPVLLSDIGPHREIWERAPCVGGLFELGSKKSLKTAFCDIFRSNSACKSKAALSLVESDFSALAMSKNYQKVYRKLIHGVSQ